MEHPSQRVRQFHAFLQKAHPPPDQLFLYRRPFRKLLSWAALHYLPLKSAHLSAKIRLWGWQKFALLSVIFFSAAALIYAPLNSLIIFNLSFILFCLTIMGIRGMLLYLSMTDHRPRSPQDEALLKDNDLPIITILCPLYKEELGLPGLIEALLALDYPHHKLDIKIILEEKDAGTIRLAHKLCAQAPFDMVVVPDGPLKTKPKACNYALWSALGELLVIYDAEDRPEPGQLRLAASTFAKLPKKVVCLQARLNYYNREETWLTRLFAIEYALLFDLVLPGLDRLGAPLPLGGTSNIFRTQCLLDLGGWDPYNVTEDADLGLRMARAGFTTQMLDSTTYEEATSKTGPWIRQRSRWIKGYLQTTLVHTRRLREKQPWQYYLTLYFLVGGVVLAALANPIFWGMYLLWLLGWGDFLEPLFPPPVSGLATFTFLAGNLLHIWLFMIAPMRRHWHDLVPYALLAPLYWGLQSWAGYKALFQFLIRPFYWEKTSHGPGQSSEAVMAKAMPQTPSIGEP